MRDLGLTLSANLVLAVWCSCHLDAAEPDWALTTTLTNPTPQYNELFGTAVCLVGDDTVAVGATQTAGDPLYSGEAHLFSRDGTLLTTFTQPNPQRGDRLGTSVAALDQKRVIVSALCGHESVEYAGVAYLFHTNGNLLTTFTNPAPEPDDLFGISAVAVGRDAVLIGRWDSATGISQKGAAYLFNTNGVLLTTLTNSMGDAYAFGYSLATVNESSVVIGAPFANAGADLAGAAYLFHTNGTLMATYTNPTPEYDDDFGIAVASAGGRTVLVGAWQDDTGATNAGAAYLFSTNGTLLTTFTNPTPEAGDWFGQTVAFVGDDLVLVGADHDKTGGSVYVFSSGGTLLTTITNPYPTLCSGLGYGLGGGTSDKFVVGAWTSDLGAPSTGAAFVYSLSGFVPIHPKLSLEPISPTTLQLSWTPKVLGVRLQETTSLSPLGWADSPIGSNTPSTIPNSDEAKLFRLVKP